MHWCSMIKPNVWVLMENMYKKTYAEVLFWASTFLKNYRREESAAAYLLRRLLNWTQTDLALQLRDEMPSVTKKQFESAVRRHAAGEPIQYICGDEIFYGRKFWVTPEVLIPRPETEELVAGLLQRFNRHFPNHKSLRLLDIGTGSGIIGITLALEHPRLKVLASDISVGALQIAKQNAAKLGANLQFYKGDLFEALPANTKNLDIIVSNPPYIPQADCEALDEIVRLHEPMHALNGGESGLDFYEKIISESPKYLQVNGMLAFEVGTGQAALVCQLMKKVYPSIQTEVVFDINGKDRMTYGFLSES